MKAGRELDALIAEKVMGWVCKTKWVEGSGSTCLTHFWYKPGNDIAPDGEGHTQGMFPSGRVSGNRVADIIPHYSTSIEDAWLVVEEMRDKGFNCCLGIVKEGVSATFTKLLSFKAYRPYGESMPHAICLAALKVVDTS